MITRRLALWVAPIACGDADLSIAPPPGEFLSHVLAIEAESTSPIFLALEAPFAERLELDLKAMVTFEAATYSVGLSAIDLEPGRLEHDPSGNPLPPPDQAFMTPLTPFEWAPITELRALASLRVRGSCVVTVAASYPFDEDEIDDGAATFLLPYRNDLLVGRRNGAIFRVDEDYVSRKLELDPPELETLAVVDRVPFEDDLLIVGRGVWTATISETTANATRLPSPPASAPVRWVQPDGARFAGLAADGSIWRFTYPRWSEIGTPNGGPEPPCGGGGSYGGQPAFIRAAAATLTVADETSIRERTFVGATSGFCSMASLTGGLVGLVVGSDAGELFRIDGSQIESLTDSPVGQPIVAVVPVDRTIVLITAGGLVGEHQLGGLTRCPARKLIAGDGPFVARRWGKRQVMVASDGVLTLLDVRE